MILDRTQQWDIFKGGNHSLPFDGAETMNPLLSEILNDGLQFDDSILFDGAETMKALLSESLNDLMIWSRNHESSSK